MGTPWYSQRFWHRKSPWKSCALTNAKSSQTTIARREPKGPEGTRRDPKGPEGTRREPKGTEGNRREPKGPKGTRRHPKGPEQTGREPTTFGRPLRVKKRHGKHRPSRCEASFLALGHDSIMPDSSKTSRYSLVNIWPRRTIWASLDSESETTAAQSQRLLLLLLRCPSLANWVP